MSTEVYIIIGETGEYADRSDWFVKSFFDANKALYYLAKLDAIVSKHDVNRTESRFASNGFFEIEAREALNKELNEYDPMARCDYTGIRYYIKTIDVE